MVDPDETKKNSVWNSGNGLFFLLSTRQKKKKTTL